MLPSAAEGMRQILRGLEAIIGVSRRFW